MIDNENIPKSSPFHQRRGGWLGLSPVAWAAILAVCVVVLDQVVKILVKTTFYMGEDLEVFPWFHIKFIENNGMAFGLELGSKVLLTLGRIVAVIFLCWFLARLKQIPNLRAGFVIAVGLIAAGAAGNIFDCVFYGEIFNNPYPPQVAEAFPKGGGYAGWFEGRVVDMLYFPFFSFFWPDWVPFIGGTEFEFFQYIFNIADSAICIGVALLIFFYSKDVSIAFSTLFGEKSETGSDELK